MTMGKLGVPYNQTELPLKYTPRRFVREETSQNFFVIQSSHGYEPSASRMEQTGEEETARAPLIKAAADRWASCMSIVDVAERAILWERDFEANEAAFSITFLRFASSPDDQFLAVGLGKDVTLAPRTCSSASINLYKVVDGGKSVELVHQVRVY